MGFIGINEVLESLGISKASVEDLLRMTPEEIEEYYKENTWSRGERDSEPIRLDFDKPVYDGENLLLYWDDRWMKGANNNDGKTNI